jgi:type VI secretion system protein ImpC
MSSADQQNQAKAATTAEAGGTTLLDEMLATAGPMAPRERVTDMIGALVGEAMQGTVTFDRNVVHTLSKAVDQIDATLSKQLAAVMHHPEFAKLEGAWRGLHYLVQNTETSAQLKVKVLNISKRELFKDLDRAVEFDQSQMFKKLYEDEFGTPGGEPFGTLIGDYEWTNHPEDVDTLSKMSQVSAAAFAPFISAADPKLFGFQSFTELSKPRDLERIFLSQEYTKWKSFRESEDSRFVTLTMPRVLARLPYGSNTKVVDAFGYEEAEFDANGKAKAMQHDHYCWMNAAYVMGTKMTDAFAKHGWCTAIRGAENGGMVENLPTHVFYSDDGDPDLKCPTEIGITDRRENELSKLGFLPLCHYKNTDYSVFFGAQTTQKPKKYDDPDATANAAISTRLPYMMATSRIAHFLKVIARDKIGSFMERRDCQIFLERWISQYVMGDPNSSADQRAKFPLAEAKILVEEIPEKPGSYNAVAFLRPWLQLEELTTSLRLVARIPTMGK